MSYKLLIVDDEMANLRLLERLFRRYYQCLTASSGAEAIGLLEQHDIATVITDQRMPQMTGIELLKHTAELRPHMVRILLTGYTDVETLVEAINSGLVYMYVNKPWNNDDLKVRVSCAIDHYENNKRRYTLESANQRLTTKLNEMKFGFVTAMTDALKAKDEYSYDQASRVSSYASVLGQRLELSPAACMELSAAAFLHDVGSIGTPDRILLNSERLTGDDLAIFQAHSERGARILAAVPELSDMADIVWSHHENFDGSGYPRGLQGEQIPLSARIISVADGYDLITNSRHQQGALSHENAINALRERSGKDFDPKIVQVLSEISRKDLIDPGTLIGQRIVASLPVQVEDLTCMA